jgi:hypothetical protein
MFAEELKAEFLKRVSIILDMDDLTKVEKISAIGKVFVEFEKRNKALMKAKIPIPVKARRAPTAYNLFIKEKMGEMTTDIVPSKERFRMASMLWNRG